MLVFPKEKPLLTNLNTFYLKLDKLIEHCQGEFGAGGIFLNSVAAQGAVFFDQEAILSGYLTEKNGELLGDAAVERLLKTDFDYNFSVDIYSIAQKQVYFWSSIPVAEKIYKDLSTDFTDLEGLIRKMSAEKLTGFIDVELVGGRESGMIFLSGGEIIGGSFSWNPGGNGSAKEHVKDLIEMSKAAGGIFQVSRLPMEDSAHRPQTEMSPASAYNMNTLKMLEEFISIFEKIYKSRKDKPADFNSLLRNKFVQNADRFEFLDPFAEEFEYHERQITFTGDADDGELANGIIVSINELAEDVGVTGQLKNYLTSWYRKYEALLDRLGIHF
jgi:hypothetical protein